MNQVSPSLSKTGIENDISDSAYARIVELSHSQAGIVLSPSKVPMVKSRLTRRLRSLGISTFDKYLEFLEKEKEGPEMSAFISALTTNVTQFFRENHHFEFIKTTVLPEIKAKLARGERVRIWSAGCSNGQEPYTIAMTLLENDSALANADIKILATDIDPQVLQTAQKGEYSEQQINGIPDDFITRFFEPRPNDESAPYKVKQELKDLITFRRLNLHSNWPMQGSFDLIMCRNVMIYFDDATQNVLLKNYCQKLTNEGWLMIGHSERMPDEAATLFKSVGVTTYKRA